MYSQPYVENEMIWKQDSITRGYRNRFNERLNNPRKMSNKDLANVITYSRVVDSPYAKELVRRAKCEALWKVAQTAEEQDKVVRKAAAKFGFRMY